MQLGRFTIEQLSEGQFEVYKDGTILRKPVTIKSTGTRNSPAIRHSSRIGIGPVLVSDARNNVLLDTGLGWGLDAGSRNKDVSNVITNLDIFNRSPEDITHVILTHLHYDHAAGSTLTDHTASTAATFPNARYYVQRREWEFALYQLGNSQSVKEGVYYQLDDLYRLVADGKIEFLDDDFTELLPGFKVLWTGGHTPGHQAVRIEDEKNVAYYLGDLLPSEYHLNRYLMSRKDVSPFQSRKMKTQLLRTACKENAVLLFYHSLYSRAGILGRDQDKNFILKKV